MDRKRHPIVTLENKQVCTIQCTYMYLSHVVISIDTDRKWVKIKTNKYLTQDIYIRYQPAFY